MDRQAFPEADNVNMRDSLFFICVYAVNVFDSFDNQHFTFLDTAEIHF